MIYLERKFVKMHGIGNDYVYIDCTKQDVSNPNELSVRLSDRHFSIGGDGLILIYKSDVADFRMAMYNNDGSEGKMCGNGIRCVGKFVYDYGLTDKTSISVETLSGIKYLDLTLGSDKLVESVTVDMGKAEIRSGKVPVNLPAVASDDPVINKPVEIGGKDYNITCVSMGNPHCIVYMDGIDAMDIETVGRQFEKNEIFPEWVNTEFVERLDDGSYKMRVWERGTGETLACGTGACAVVVSGVLNRFSDHDQNVTVHLAGGDLDIVYKQNGTVMMNGSAETAFYGFVEI